MRKFLYAPAVACAALCILLGTSLSPARAHESAETVREAQVRLADLGYYAGHFDGVMGRATENAVLDFQRTNGLPASGFLTAETSHLLFYTTYAARHPYNGYYPAGYYGHGYDDDHRSHIEPANGAGPVDWHDRWAYADTRIVPSRFARIDIDEDDRGSRRHYVVTLNGRAVLFANNQPGILRVSKTFAMEGEDTIVFTAYQGDGVCAYKNYVMSVRANGTSVGPREIGSCAGSYEAHVADNGLMMAFPDRPGAWSVDTWRYKNGALRRI